MKKSVKISKTVDLKITSGFIYSLQIGTTLTEDVEVENEEEYLTECSRVYNLAKEATQQDGKELLGKLKELAAKPISALDPKAVEANRDLKSLITRIQAVGINND